MRQHGLERRRAVARQREQQRGLKPAAMLVAAFQIHVGLPVECGLRIAGCGMVKVPARRISTAREDEPESIHTSSVSLDLATASGAFPILRFQQATRVRRRISRTRRSSRVFRSNRRRCGRFARRESVRLWRRKTPESARPRCAGARCTSRAAIATAPLMRLTPQSGIQFTRSISARAALRKVAGS